MPRHPRREQVRDPVDRPEPRPRQDRLRKGPARPPFRAHPDPSSSSASLLRRSPRPGYRCSSAAWPTIGARRRRPSLQRRRRRGRWLSLLVPAWRFSLPNTVQELGVRQAPRGVRPTDDAAYGIAALSAQNTSRGRSASPRSSSARPRRRRRSSRWRSCRRSRMSGSSCRGRGRRRQRRSGGRPSSALEGVVGVSGLCARPVGRRGRSPRSSGSPRRNRRGPRCLWPLYPVS